MLLSDTQTAPTPLYTVQARQPNNVLATMNANEHRYLHLLGWWCFWKRERNKKPKKMISLTFLQSQELNCSLICSYNDPLSLMVMDAWSQFTALICTSSRSWKFLFHERHFMFWQIHHSFSPLLYVFYMMPRTPTANAAASIGCQSHVHKLSLLSQQFPAELQEVEEIKGRKQESPLPNISVFTQNHTFLQYCLHSAQPLLFPVTWGINMAGMASEWLVLLHTEQTSYAIMCTSVKLLPNPTRAGYTGFLHNEDHLQDIAEQSIMPRTWWPWRPKWSRNWVCPSTLSALVLEAPLQVGNIVHASWLWTSRAC